MLTIAAVGGLFVRLRHTTCIVQVTTGEIIITNELFK